VTDDARPAEATIQQVAIRAQVTGALEPSLLVS